MTKKFPPISKPINLVEQLKAGLPPVKIKAKPVAEPSLQVQMPAMLIKQLKLAAIEKETSVRVIVLEALRAQGFDVGEIRDRRRAG
jgi:hypothetical protein